jgi:pyruvate/2-oxoglutarate dehydrogenase complex dihydrolipoamide dehydrogenase (E3) component
MSVDHDVIILGGGSAGYAAARTARDEGADVAVVDPGPLGGLCILRGCMPSKAILRSSDVMSLIRRAPEFGLLAVEPGADLGAVIDRKDRLIQEFADYRVEQLRGFTLYEHPARFVSVDEIEVGDRHVPIPGLDEVGYITSDDALDLRDLPASLLVLGGGAIACELAQFYGRLGVPTTMIQRSHHIISHTDEDLARPVEARFRDEGMALFTGTQLRRLERANGLATVHFAHGDEERTAAAEVVFQALGRRPNIDGLGLEAADVRVEDHRVCVDDEMRTSQPHIFAAGDVNGLHEIVHIAVLQGEAAGYNAVHLQGEARRMDSRLDMEVTFTDPQVATLGLLEKECQAEDVPYRVASYPFDDHGKSMTLGELHGHVKILCEPQTGEILGAGIVGPEAGELIHELAAVMHFRGTVRDVVDIPHYHPTLAEILTYPAEELAEQLDG